MKRTFTTHSQFVAFYDFNEDNKRLFVTLKNGVCYVCAHFGVSDYTALEQATNKGGHIYHKIFNCRDFKISKIAKFDPIEVQRTVQKQYEKRNCVFRPSNEGWQNFLSK